jgi:hypothetical protein
MREKNLNVRNAKNLSKDYSTLSRISRVDEGERLPSQDVERSLVEIMSPERVKVERSIMKTHLNSCSRSINQDIDDQSVWRL